ncbi:MAG: hypothetical protein K0R57_3784 [Paenibacillaceae bacterium]|jgi:heme/copper-type cytochrome/quinol oxidase subunit 2|nr:hypothetical protein [Paenibacillaceae bacterium]
MIKIIVVKRRHLWLGGLACVLVVCGAVFFWLKGSSTVPVDGDGTARIIRMAATELKTTANNGTAVESYRWNPETVQVEKNEQVNLVITGVNGENHPFYIEGTAIKGSVGKGQETTVAFQPDKEGVYRIICTAHSGKNHQEPMIGYIVVK